jgi:hypothetical protein
MPFTKEQYLIFHTDSKRKLNELELWWEPQEGRGDVPDSVRQFVVKTMIGLQQEIRHYEQEMTAL